MTPGPSDDAPTVWWRILLYLTGVMAGLGVLGLLGFDQGGLAGSASALLLAGTASGWALLRIDGRPPRALGLALRAGAPRELGVGTLVGVALLLPILGLLALAGGFRLGADAGDAATLWSVAAESLLLLTVAAAAEEVLVRGYPLQLLAKAWGPLPALAATSVVFGLVHLGNPGMGWLAVVNVSLAGAFLGILVLQTGSLWWATGAHLGWNWGQAFLADLPVSGLDVVDAPLWEGSLHGALWLSGGEFGVEGSILTAAVMTAAAIWTWTRSGLRPVGPRWWMDEDERFKESKTA